MFFGLMLFNFFAAGICAGLFVANGGAIFAGSAVSFFGLGVFNSIGAFAE